MFVWKGIDGIFIKAECIVVHGWAMIFFSLTSGFQQLKTIAKHLQTVFAILGSKRPHP